MPRPIDYRTTSPYPAERMFAAMADPEYLRARLAEMGGKGAELLEHTADGKNVRYRLRQGLDNAALPPVVQSLVGGDLVIERTETLRPVGSGGYAGDVDVHVPGTPVTAGGSMTLTDRPGGSVFVVEAEVTVRVPLFGGRIEKVVAEQVAQLLAAEAGFTEKWIAEHPG